MYDSVQTRPFNNRIARLDYLAFTVELRKRKRKTFMQSEKIRQPSAECEHLKQLAGVDGEDKRALDHLFSLIYEELRRIASFIRRRELDCPLNSTALVHEAWLKLKDFPSLALPSETHFKALAARAMREILVDQARQRNARKRGGADNAIFVTLGDAPEAIASSDAELLALDAALEELKALNPRQATMVQNRFFGGFSVAETAALLGVSESSIERDWRAAKAWLKGRIRRQRE
jgi:RNA polymerase sigma factor (TIGR02999 family)